MSDDAIGDLAVIKAWTDQMVPRAHWTSFLMNHVDAGIAIAVSELLFPTFVMHGQAMFRAAALGPKGIDGPRERFDDIASVETQQIANHLHIWEQFPDVTTEIAVYEGYGPEVVIWAT